MKRYNVVSLFDGQSCGQIALTELGIKVNKYYASEVDKFAIEQTQLNFPNTIQLGDVERWREWDINWNEIDLLLAGSPCQGFSFAGKMLAFDDPRSKLFFVFVDILNHIKSLNPNVKFLLENVNMKRTHMEVITRYVGVFPVNINSNLVSAQNRNRWYWSNIKTKEVGFFGEIHTDIEQPIDRGIYLKDILEAEVDEKYYLSEKMINGLSNRPKGYDTFEPVGIDYQGKARCNTSRVHKMGSADNYIIQYSRGFNKGGCFTEKSPTVTSNSWEHNNHLVDNTVNRIRRLTPTECSRLQTLPTWYKWECSDTQQYRMLGNGWTVEVICHILKHLVESENKQTA